MIIKRNLKDMNTSVIVSHGDLDGVASAFIIAQAMEKVGKGYIINVDLNPTQAKTDELVKEALYEICGDSNGEVIIADRDICTSDVQDICTSIVWLDHHITSINKFNCNGENEYDLTRVKTYLTTESTEAGVTMAYQYYKDIVGEKNESLENIVSNTATWDTFSWKDLEADSPERAAAIIYGYASYMCDPATLFSVLGYPREGRAYTMKTLARLYDEKRLNAIVEAQKGASEFKMKGSIKGIIVNDVEPQFISMVSDSFIEDGADIVLVFNDELLSARAAKHCNVHLGNAMKYIGEQCGNTGGGHAKAAGCKIGSTPVHDVLDMLRTFIG